MKALRTSLCVSLMALAMAGCSVLGSEQRDPVTIYAPDVRVPARAEWPVVTWTLVIAKPTAARVVDSPRISVRPTPGELQVYRGVSWAQPATDLVQDAVQRTLEDSGRIPAVASADAGILGDYKLVMDVRRFEADYAGAAVPSAVVEINAKLVSSRDQRVVASRTFLQQQPAASVEVAQVAQAFDGALAAATGDLVGWLLAAGQGDAPRRR
ncbi:MAG TPA: ABC-type transport auxiliary lipoprotein family protein [Pseudoxanthomonas sp.]|nr:ABC-type transport auxiliary lipoprotein family protein [Pseudoxanthomonas sp.]